MKPGSSSLPASSIAAHQSHPGHLAVFLGALGATIAALPTCTLSAPIRGRTWAPTACWTCSPAPRGAGCCPGLGWKVLLRQPEATAMAGFHAPEVRILWAALALCELLTPLLWLQARRLAAPLWELATHRPGP